MAMFCFQAGLKRIQRPRNNTCTCTGYSAVGNGLCSQTDAHLTGIVIIVVPFSSRGGRLYAGSSQAWLEHTRCNPLDESTKFKFICRGEPPIQCVLGLFSGGWGVKLTIRPSSSAEVKMGGEPHSFAPPHPQPPVGTSLWRAQGQLCLVAMGWCSSLLQPPETQRRGQRGVKCRTCTAFVFDI